jgi:polysaccharide chain length determinant protein (PEP-CTERM system associated)
LSAFKIAYSAPDPRLAQQVTDQLSSLFIQENLRNRQQLSENTTEFLETQLAQAGKDLARQEAHLRDFKSKYLGELPEQLQSTVQILSGLQTRLQAATEALNQAHQQKLYLESWLGQYKSLRSNLESRKTAAGAARPSLDDELDKLRAELADMSGRYTANHPDVLRLKEQVAQAEKLQEQADAQIAARQSKNPTEAVSTARSFSDLQAMSPMLQIEGQIKANRLEIANRHKEVRALEQEIDTYRRRLHLMPVREQELAAITRDHEQSRTNYESLLNKKMQSQMATSLEKREEGEQFHIIDPPNMPQKPYWPDRLKFSVLGVLFGTVLALGITALLEIVDGRVNREEDLRNLVAAPVLAGIPLIHTPSEQRQYRRNRALEAAAASVLLMTIPVTTFVTYFRG